MKVGVVGNPRYGDLKGVLEQVAIAAPYRGITLYSEPRLESLAQQHSILVTVEEGTIVNGFGAYLAETLQTTHPEVRVVALGVPDRLIEQAPRAEQLDSFGLTAAGIARRITALQHEESLEAR